MHRQCCRQITKGHCRGENRGHVCTDSVVGRSPKDTAEVRTGAMCAQIHCSAVVCAPPRDTTQVKTQLLGCVCTGSTVVLCTGAANFTHLHSWQYCYCMGYLMNGLFCLNAPHLTIHKQESHPKHLHDIASSQVF